MLCLRRRAAPLSLLLSLLLAPLCAPAAAGGPGTREWAGLVEVEGRPTFWRLRNTKRQTARMRKGRYNRRLNQLRIKAFGNPTGLHARRRVGDAATGRQRVQIADSYGSVVIA